MYNIYSATLAVNRIVGVFSFTGNNSLNDAQLPITRGTSYLNVLDIYCMLTLIKAEINCFYPASHPLRQRCSSLAVGPHVYLRLPDLEALHDETQNGIHCQKVSLFLGSAAACSLT